MATREGFVHDLVRGWDTFLHTCRMLLFSIIWAGLVSLVMSLVIAGVYSFHYSSPEQRQVSLLWLRATGLHLICSDRTPVLFEKNGKTYSWPAGQVFRSQDIRQAAFASGRVACRGLISGGVCGVILFSSAIGFALMRGRKMRLDQLIRGSEKVEPESLAQKLKRDEIASDISIGSVPMIAGTEPQHVFITGTPGTGKSVLISSMLDVIRSRGERAIVYDSSGDFLSKFWRDNDKILNPLDARGEAWTPWAEIRSPYDADRLAEALIPSEGKSDPFWSQAARQLFAGALTKLPTKSVSELLDHLLTSDLSSLAGIVEGTDAAALLGEGNEKMALSVRATLATYVRSLRFLRSGGIEQPFSIRSWIEGDSSSWLYVTSRADQHAALRPLITCWLDVAASAIMSLPPSRTRRIWIILDELPHLAKMPSVPQLLAMGRKYGACGVMGIQTIAQLRDIYGRDGAEALAGMASTWVVFRTSDPDTADWTSRAMGESDLDEAQESISYSAEETRDGVSLRSDRKTRRVVLPTEIMFCPNLRAYVRLPGDFPVTQVPLVPLNRTEVAAPFVGTDLSQTVWGRLSTSPDAIVQRDQPHASKPIASEPVDEKEELEQEEQEVSEAMSLDMNYDEGGRGWH